MPETTPFVKWAGGKGQLVERLKARMPESYSRYYEPFIGGGALLLSVRPESAVINDINEQLIHTYRTIRDNAEDLISTVVEFDKVSCDEAYYYEMRNQYNKKIFADEYDVEIAALFIYINKHCFNGLYRVNKKGGFNVPWNQADVTSSVDQDNIRAISAYLRNVDILCGDFAAAVSTAKSGDFVFFDSPYAPLKVTSFESYTKAGFSEEEHRRLAALFAELDKRGCMCMLTNHNTPLIQEIYAGYSIEEVDVKRMINSNAANRTGKEVIIRNY